MKLACHSEPLNFDIVVGCNVKITRYQDNDRIVEVGVPPFAHGLKMADGRGVLVRPLEAYEGKTRDMGERRTEVPKNFVACELLTINGSNQGKRFAGGSANLRA